jgi:RNA polymerase sigma-70 factor (ECF subfamily)
LPEPDPRADDVLIAAANHGDEQAMEALYHRYKDWVVRLARRFTAHDDDALDVLQETFTYLFRKFPGFRLTAAMTTFLYPVVRNLSLAARRKRSGGGRMVADDQLLDIVPAPLQPDDPRQELSAVMTSLSPLHREVVLMRFVDDMTLQEIAVALSIPIGTAKSRLHNALASLRDDPRTRRYFDQP